MSTFQDMVEKDRLDVFLAVDFFGAEAVVEGKHIIIVIDNDELKERQGGQDLAIVESASLFYARSEDLPRRRPAGESLNINGRECLIDYWQEDMGIATIAVRENITI